jgi:predicted RNase H-like HicB family nuclease
MDELRSNLEEAIKLWLEAGEAENTLIEDGEIMELAI